MRSDQIFLTHLLVTLVRFRHIYTGVWCNALSLVFQFVPLKKKLTSIGQSQYFIFLEMFFSKKRTVTWRDEDIFLVVYQNLMRLQ